MVAVESLCHVAPCNLFEVVVASDDQHPDVRVRQGRTHGVSADWSQFLVVCPPAFNLCKIEQVVADRVKALVVGDPGEALYRVLAGDMAPENTSNATRLPSGLDSRHSLSSFRSLGLGSNSFSMAHGEATRNDVRYEYRARALGGATGGFRALALRPLRRVPVTL